MDITPMEDVPQERSEDPATACERDCLKRLYRANELSRFDTAKAWVIWDEVSKRLTPALERRWPMGTVLAMHTLLRANLWALSSDGLDDSLEKLRLMYGHAIFTAQEHADELYVLRAKRAYAAVLACHGEQSEALRLLLRIRVALKKMENLGHEEHDLWLQTTIQLAEVCWQLGGVDSAFRLMNSIHYPEKLNMYHVAARILHVRLMWHAHKGQTSRVRRMYRRVATRIARQAARDIHQVDSYCHPSSVKRARLLRLPLLGVRLYERAYNKLICPRL